MEEDGEVVNWNIASTSNQGSGNGSAEEGGQGQLDFQVWLEICL